MHRLLSRVVIACVVLSAPLAAQQQPMPVEIGIDATLSRQLGDPHQTLLSIPESRIRVGFFVSPMLSIEPSLGLTRLSGSGASTTSTTLGVGVLVHLTPTRTAMRPYVRPFLDYVRATRDNDNGQDFSSSNTGVGVGLGATFPLADRVATRLEVAIEEIDSHTLLQLRGGLSFFTR